MTTVEVFADITCPFAHVGLKHVAEHVAEHVAAVGHHGDGHHVDVIVRAWPLEWVNDEGLDIDGVQTKAAALHEQLGVDDFSGLRADRWPTTTIPALELAAAAYAADAATGLAVSLDLRAALFERGLDISDDGVLADIAARHGVTLRHMRDAVRADYEEGLTRDVSGSPHFWVGDDNFFCPSLELGRDEENNLTARFDAARLTEFFAILDR